jgi:hypothetical protein
MHPVFRRWTLALKVLPLALVAVLVKYGLHLAGWEVISLNMLFSGLLAATVFLIGFLLSGVLSDYKESEKLPGELAVSLETLFDEGSIVCNGKHPVKGKAFLAHLLTTTRTIHDWLYGRRTFDDLMEEVSSMNVHFHGFEDGVAPNYIARMKGEQTSLRRVLTRVRMVKETSFVTSGYVIAEITATLLIIGFLLAKIDPFYESLFFVGMITFLFTYMLRLIRDLDDPFEYKEGSQGPDEVSLAPLLDVESRMTARFAALSAPEKVFADLGEVVRG